jgi:WD40 repeat protein
MHTHADGSITALAQSADVHLRVTGGYYRIAGLCDLPTLSAIGMLPSVNGTVLAAAFSSDGHSLAIAESRQIELWDTRSWQRGEPLGRTQRWFDAAFSHTGDRLATAGDDGTLRVWDPRATAVVESEQLADGKASARRPTHDRRRPRRVHADGVRRSRRVRCAS